MPAERSSLTIMMLMDDCLIAMGDGHPIPQKTLRQLPPWRAVMVASVAVRAGAMSKDDYEVLRAEARRVGGEGRLSNG